MYKEKAILQNNSGIFYKGRQDMATILKCKMCGGDIEVNEDMSVGTCIYCGSTMTLPRIDGDKKARLFNMANQYRLNNEFDKAYEAYKNIVSEDEQEAEAYWGMILSEYGVEYVEDPKTKRRIPTCHRTLAKPVKSSVNYERAYEYADAERRMMYSDEADVINDLQKKILAVSSSIEPYDVFICYKETDDDTKERTQDSVIAQDIYNELEKQGLKTFFARISLESILGKDYEPHIYAALHSAKVMLVVTTSASHCKAVWVKNEWSRYLGFMEEDASKTLIPVYKDMSPYELPDELAKYQAQDMSKIGAIQDLVTGVKKLCGRTVTQANNETMDMLLRDKIEREEREAKKEKEQIIHAKKKRKKIILGSVLSVLSIVLIIFVIVPLINAIKISKISTDSRYYYNDVISSYNYVKISPIKYVISTESKSKIAKSLIAKDKPEEAAEIIFYMCDNNELNDMEKGQWFIKFCSTADYEDAVTLYEKIDTSLLDKNMKFIVAKNYLEVKKKANNKNK